MKILALGAGVQSTAMLLMAEAGEFGPKPDHAIFSDTGWEPPEVYEHLNRLEEATSIPIHRVSAGDIREKTLKSKSGTRYASLPFWTRTSNGKEGPLRRQCTKEYKIEPITKKIRELLGLKRGQRAAGKYQIDQWFGITTDEASRMKPSGYSWITSCYPLIEKSMHREDCVTWLAKAGWDRPAKSACIGCPYHSDLYWREMKRERPEEWQQAVEFDKEIRSGLRGVSNLAYIHRSLQPLDEVDLRTREDRGQVNMFIEECEGMCGV